MLIYDKFKHYTHLYNIRFLSRKLSSLLIIAVLFYFFYLFKQERFSVFTRNNDNRISKILYSIKKQTCKNIIINGLKYSDYKYVQNNINEYCSNKEKTLKILRNSIIKDPWIKDLKIVVKLPNTTIININEYSPFALLTNDNKNYKLVDESGIIIETNQNDISMFGYLLKITGDNMKDYEMNNLFNIMSIHSEITKNINSITRIGNRRWNIVFTNNIIVKMPEYDEYMLDTLNILDNIIKIYGIMSNLKEIDMRNKDKIYLKYSKDFSKNINTSNKF